MSDDSLWDRHAQWWIDGFTNGADPEYEEQIIPLALEELSGFGSVLDVGCGDGQISRALARSGCTVTGIDPTERNLEVARERAGGPTYIKAGATDLPFDDGSFDAVVACLVFEHIDDVDGAIAEVPASCAQVAVSRSSSTIRCSRPRGAGGSMTTSSTRRSSTGALARTWWRRRASRRSSSVCTSGSFTDRCPVTSTPSSPTG